MFLFKTTHRAGVDYRKYSHIRIYGGALLTYTSAFSATLLKGTLHTICASLLRRAHCDAVCKMCTYVPLFLTYEVFSTRSGKIFHFEEIGFSFSHDWRSKALIQTFHSLFVLLSINFILYIFFFLPSFLCVFVIYTISLCGPVWLNYTADSKIMYYCLHWLHRYTSIFLVLELGYTYIHICVLLP